MPRQMSATVRNAIANAYEAAIGPNAIVKLRTGPQPASCSAADAGSVVATINTPADWMAAAANGSVVKAGVWEDDAADATGQPGHFRVYAADGVTCHDQGSVTLTGEGGDLTIDNTSINAGQKVTITGFSLTAGGA